MVAITSFTVPGGPGPNQDAYLVEAHPADAAVWLCVLADGQGGQRGGGEAARLACRVAMDVLLAARPKALAVASAWADVLHAADRAVEADAEAGYTTLVAFALVGDFLIGASNGDSAVLVVTDGRATETTAQQRKNPPVGSGGAAVVPFGAALTRPWSVLAMSDGVWKYAGWDGLVEAATTWRGEELLARLQAAVRSPGTGSFPDDFTAVLFEGAD